MGFLKDAGDSLLKYGGILVNKTEEYTRIAKLNLEIKKNESDIEKCHLKLGKILSTAMDKGETSLDLNQESVSSLYGKIISFRQIIEGKRNEIEALKQERAGEEGRPGRSGFPGSDRDDNL
jgi:hypothetical protein